MRKRMRQLTDDTPMPWGAHKGTPMKDVPAKYLLWLLEQPWLKDWPQVQDYIERHADQLYEETEEEEEDSYADSGGFTSYQDFLDNL